MEEHSISLEAAAVFEHFSFFPVVFCLYSRDNLAIYQDGVRAGHLHRHLGQLFSQAEICS